MAVRVPVEAKSRKKELKSILFESEKIEFDSGLELVYTGGDAEFSGFEPEVIVKMEVIVGSTESINEVSEYLHDKLGEIDETSLKVGEEQVDVEEEKIKRRLIKAFYRS